MKTLPSFEFYKNYLKDLEYSLKFNKTCLDKGYIASNDISPFDNSIYDCYKLGIEKNKDLKCITDGNKQFNNSVLRYSHVRPSHINNLIPQTLCLLVLDICLSVSARENPVSVFQNQLL